MQHTQVIYNIHKVIIIHIYYFCMTVRLNLATLTTPFKTIDQAPLKLFVNSSFVQEISYCGVTRKIEGVHKQEIGERKC